MVFTFDSHPEQTTSSQAKKTATSPRDLGRSNMESPIRYVTVIGSEACASRLRIRVECFFILSTMEAFKATEHGT